MKTSGLAAAAIIAGMLAAVGCHLYLSGCERYLQSAHEPCELLVARRTIAEGEKLGREDVEVARLARRLVPVRALTTADLVLLDGAHARREVVAGSPICATDLVEAGRAMLARRIAPSRRAMTVPVSRVTSVAHMIAPGDRVDILVAGRRDALEPVSSSATQSRLVEVVLENAEVLAVGSDLDPNIDPPRDYDSVTIHVTTAEADQVLAAMVRHGSWDGLTLLLRGAVEEVAQAR
jgi:pilus assembly protein CpaB